MVIAFVHEFKAFLPEIAAYTWFFKRFGKGIKTEVIHPRDLRSIKPDVEWRFMGLQRSKSPAPVLIHEYASASLPPWRHAKDYIKRHYNVKPDFRLFLNEYVKDRLSFKDQLPFGFRDMGIFSKQLEKLELEKFYDFIYVGSVSKDMQMETLLDRFTRKDLREKKLLVLSKDYQALHDQYAGYPNIIFMGPIQQQDVGQQISQSHFAINYKPDIAPHSHQTSTKLLDYAACQVPIITTDFAWMRNFQQQYGGNYLYLSKDLSNLTWENAVNFQYSSPDLSSWLWQKQISGSGVLEFLESKFGNLGFNQGNRG